MKLLAFGLKALFSLALSTIAFMETRNSIAELADKYTVHGTDKVKNLIFSLLYVAVLEVIAVTLVYIVSDHSAAITAITSIFLFLALIALVIYELYLSRAATAWRKWSIPMTLRIIFCIAALYEFFTPIAEWIHTATSS